MRLDLPAIDDAGNALWPERWPVSALERIKASIGARAWASLYQQRPSPAEGGILKRHWWKFWSVPGQPLDPVIVHTPDGPVSCPVVPLPYDFDEEIQSWDLSFKETSDGSYVVGQVWARAGADAFLRAQIRDRMDFPRTVHEVEALSRQWPRTGAKLVEEAANGAAVIATLRHRVPGLVAVKPDKSKAARANAVAPYVEAGNVFLPHPRIAPFDVLGLIEEAAALPTGAHDDQADALTQAVSRLLGGGGIEAVADAMVESMRWRSGGG